MEEPAGIETSRFKVKGEGDRDFWTDLPDRICQSRDATGEFRCQIPRFQRNFDSHPEEPTNELNLPDSNGLEFSEPDRAGHETNHRRVREALGSILGIREQK
jgi:hypothetical protein